MLQQQQLINKLVSNNTQAEPEAIKSILKNAKKGLSVMVDLLYQYSKTAISLFKSDVEVPIYYQQLCLSALQLHDMKTAEFGLSKLKQFYGITLPLARIRARIIEVKQIYNQTTQSAESYTLNLVKNDMSDPQARKIHVSVKSADSIDEYMKQLNLFIKSFPADIEAWQQLGSIYTTTANYTKALFCYEQLIVLNPSNSHYYVRLAQLLYTQGGFTNLRNAKDYLCFIVAKDKTNYRALWILNRVVKSLISEKPENIQTLVDLEQTSQQLLINFYKNRKSSVKIDLTKFKF